MFNKKMLVLLLSLTMLFVGTTTSFATDIEEKGSVDNESGLQQGRMSLHNETMTNIEIENAVKAVTTNNSKIVKKRSRLINFAKGIMS